MSEVNIGRTVDLGAVSAYAIAVEHGYRGTEAEWIAEWDIVRQEAQAAEEALGAGVYSVRYNAAQTLTDVQKAQARENVEAASTTEVEDLNSAISAIEETVTDGEIYNWENLSPGTLSWANGYYGRAGGGINTSSVRCMRSAVTFWEPSDGCIRFHIKAPTGYYVAVHVYSSSGDFIETIGYQGLPNNMSGVTEEVTVTHAQGNKYHFSLGVFDDVTNYLNSDFVNTIVLTEHKDVIAQIKSDVIDVEGDVADIKNDIVDINTAIDKQQVAFSQISEGTKNLFDYQNANIFSGNIANSNGTYKITNGNYKLFWLPVISGEYYSIQKISSYRFRYGTTATTPMANVELLSQSVGNDSATAKTHQIPDGANYLVVMYYSPANDTLTEQQILESIMVEKGQSVTEYVPAKTAVDYIARQTISNAVGGNLFAMYDHLTCIGDSLTYSEVFTGETAHRQAKRTYPDVLAALSGNTAENIGRMGYSTAEWWAECSSLLQTKTNQLFIVYLGTNYGLTDTIDTDCPGTDISQFADTNTGCYGKILQTAKNLGANAVLIHIYGGGGTGGVETTNSVIDKFGERYGFAVLDNDKLLDNCYHIWPNRQGMNNLHYNDLGYAVFAGRLIATVNALSPDEAVKLVPLT